MGLFLGVQGGAGVGQAELGAFIIGQCCLQRWAFPPDRLAAAVPGTGPGRYKEPLLFAHRSSLGKLTGPRSSAVWL